MIACRSTPTHYSDVWIVDPRPFRHFLLVSVIPGDQYRIHTVRALGLTDLQQKEFDSAWRLHPGDPYDTVYVATFLQKNTALRSLAGHSKMSSGSLGVSQIHFAS